MSNKVFTVFGSPLPIKKVAEVAFRNIYGVGPHEARKLCAKLGMNPHTKLDACVGDLPRIAAYIEKNYSTREQVDAAERNAIRTKVSIGCYKGIRHQQALPVNGQKTKTNGKTQKQVGKRRAYWAGIGYTPRKGK